MCGRFVKAGREVVGYGDVGRMPRGRYERLQALQAADESADGARGFNIAPTQRVAFLRAGPEGGYVGAVGRWGLEPRWARSPEEVKGVLFNARAESAAEKPAFRDAMRHSRCAVLVDGFYEWQARQRGPKQPWLIRRAQGEPMLLAGLYATHDWGDSFTILTTRPNSLMANLHDRMPVIVDVDDVDRWLDPEVRDPDAVADLLEPSPSEWLDAYEVSAAVSNVRNDGPELIEPVGGA